MHAAESDWGGRPRISNVVVGLSNFEQPAAGRMVDFFLNRMPAL
jgi:hypothetical protein